MSERKTVKDLLADAKDYSELMVDLAYAAVFFGDEDIAGEVVRLREEMGRVIRELRTISVLAARSHRCARARARRTDTSHADGSRPRCRRDGRDEERERGVCRPRVFRGPAARQGPRRRSCRDRGRNRRDAPRTRAMDVARGARG